MAPIETPRLQRLARDQRIIQWLKEMPPLEKLHPSTPWSLLSSPPGTIAVNDPKSGAFWKWVGIGSDKRK
ncbi:hypothetical protein Sste5344_000860 [Sporothrix stenoceras]